MNWMRRNVGCCAVMMMLMMTMGLGCNQDTPEKKIESPFMLMQSLTGATSDGAVYGIKDCEEGTGNGSLQGTIVDPYEYVDVEELGTGQALFEFCGETLAISGQSISTVLEDPGYGDYFIAAIGDFYALQGPFVLVQVETSLLDQGTIAVDGQSAAVFMLDETFERVIAFATSGSVTFSQVGTQLGDPVALQFEGQFVKEDQPPPQGNAVADFEVIVWEAINDESDESPHPQQQGVGRFSVELEDAWYQGGPDASAYRYDYCWDEEHGPADEMYVPECEAVLNITIGDLAGWTGEFMVIEAWSYEYYEGEKHSQGFEGWAYLYDNEWNLLAVSEIPGWIETDDPFPYPYDEFAGLFTGYMVPVNNPQPCEGLDGDGRGTMDTWLNRDASSVAAYIGSGHVQVATWSGELVEIGDYARATVAESTLYIEIGDVTYQSNGLVLSLSMDFNRALEGGEISVGEYAEAWAHVYDLYSYQTIGHAVAGSLSFNDIGGQDGDLVIGHFSATFESDCDDPQPECMELSTDISSDMQVQINAHGETPVTVTIGYIDPIFYPTQPLEVEAQAYIYREDFPGCGKEEDAPVYGGVFISLYIQEGQGDPLDYADVWIQIPEEEYIEGQTVHFELESNDYYKPLASYYASAMGMYAWGTLAGSIQIVDDGLETGERADLRLQFDAASACFDERGDEVPVAP